MSGWGDTQTQTRGGTIESGGGGVAEAVRHHATRDRIRAKMGEQITAMHYLSHAFDYIDELETRAEYLKLRLEAIKKP